ncbi:tyrosine-protein phosphatase [Dactylosporangium siamense]|nr:tyrosine-protein phosphatase [Dactylosporangium siamense]
MTANMAWPGGRNVRDLGGRALRDGGVTRSGLVFRSAAPEHLTDAGWAAARATGIRTVVDLRNAPTETGRTADHPVIRADSLDGLVFVAAPTEDPDDAEFLRVCGPWLDHPRSWADNARLAPARVAGAVRAVAAARPAVLVHCAGGRDRTGMICAMLLVLAGATADAVVDDYADGWRGAGAYEGHGWVYDLQRQTWDRRHLPAAEPAELDRQVAERVPAVREWIRTFDTEAFLRSAGLSGPELDTLRALLRPLSGS